MENGDSHRYHYNGDDDLHEMSVEATNFANTFGEWLEQHDRDVHDGHRCMDERLGMLAWLAHRWGVTTVDFLAPESAVFFITTLDEIEQRHNEHLREHDDD
jgi:hypothetical protein